MILEEQTEAKPEKLYVLMTYGALSYMVQGVFFTLAECAKNAEVIRVNRGVPVIYEGTIAEERE
jgi:hypothetical protein